MGAFPDSRAVSAISSINSRGKFLWAGEEKFYIRRTTYGPFHPNQDGPYYPHMQAAEHDFA